MSAAKDAEWLRWVTKQFGNIAGKDKEINLEEFKAALQVKESFFAERFFALFDADGSGTISLEELLKALSLLVHGNEMDKLRFLFQVYDVDGSGSIDPEELRLVLRWCLRESALALPEPRLADLTRALFEAADKDHSGSITFEELQQELEAFPGVMENLSISAATWLQPQLPAQKSGRPQYLTWLYWHNHRSTVAFLGGYIGLNLLLFALAALHHAGLGGWLVVARGCGQCLNFNCAFLAVLMLRRCLTWLRTTPVAEVLPLDQHIAFHQLVGYVVLALATTHTGAHVANFSRLAQQDGRDVLTEYLLYPHSGTGGLGDTAAQTGLVLQGLLVAMVTFSCPCIRQSGHFQLFYWTHLSYISIWTLLILHGPHFWKWFAVPGCLFVLEKVVGLAGWRTGGLHIVEVNLLPSKVTHLVIERPQFFHYKPGDFVYLNIPAIATYEWHPFTISSAPEQRETLWLHIRSLGQWTNKLYEYFQQPELPSPELKPLSRSLREKRSWCWTQVGGDGAQLLANTHRLCSVKCYVDGPYGTPTRQIFTSEHAVLIGAGIGITPFASILQSIMYRYRRRKQSCPSCHHSWCEDLRDEEMMLRKVDFIWINRDQKHFEWFVSLLTKLEMEQAEQEPGGRFLEMHMYMTSALGKNDMKGVGLQLALDLLATKEQRDLITGLRTRTQPGRPDWSKVFGKVAEEKKGKVQVFFCGSPALAKVIRTHCERFGFRFFKENF
ncbi:NADPH oxidase, EF-hand calcium binding domain 5 [Columba livia]|uniref:NADPH oxidase, EF-hand calcium binding domain 5 n=1 Tax=Columba livia TaxID=8932 RepID=A0A2I0MDI9_COLLI|nr:NADPH oxidase, EF-hand calcium binding domain 5 [Columba livia]